MHFELISDSGHPCPYLANKLIMVHFAHNQGYIFWQKSLPPPIFRCYFLRSSLNVDFRLQLITLEISTVISVLNIFTVFIIQVLLKYMVILNDIHGCWCSSCTPNICVRYLIALKTLKAGGE